MENLSDSAGWIAGRAAMGHTRLLAERVNLTMLVPHPELASTRYCLAHSGQEYIVYLPDCDEVTVDISDTAEQLQVEWIRAAEGTISSAESVTGGGKRVLKSPFSGDAVVHLWTPMKTKSKPAKERNDQ